MYVTRWCQLSAQTEEDYEIELNPEEPLFLKGQTTRSGVSLDPIRIVKNPEGTLQRAAITQSALARERRELREQQKQVHLSLSFLLSSLAFLCLLCVMSLRGHFSLLSSLPLPIPPLLCV